MHFLPLGPDYKFFARRFFRTNNNCRMWERGVVVGRKLKVVPYGHEPGRDDVSEGFALMKEDNPEDAIMAFRHALVEQPESAAVWSQLGQAYREAGYEIRGPLCLAEALSKDAGHAENPHILTKQWVRESCFGHARITPNIADMN
mgnify:CR=1 FL=1